MKKSKALCREKWGVRCRLFLFGMAAMLCFMKAVCHTENLEGQLGVFHFAASGRQGGMDCASAGLAQEQNLKQDALLEFVNWTQTDGVQAVSSATGSAEDCAALLLCGRSDLLFPGYAVLDLEARDDCLISSTLSERLFGGADTRGLTVEVQGRKLEVLDVIDSEEAFLVYEAGENEVCLLDRAAVRCVSGRLGKTEEGYRKLCGEWERMESRVLIWTARGACLLVPCILWIFLVRYCMCMPQSAGRMGLAEKNIWKLLSGLLLAGGALILIRKIRIPEDMIPTKWSDFEFWMEYGKKLGASCRTLLRSEKKIPDLPVWREFFRAMQWAAGAVAGEAVFLREFRRI